MSRRDQIKLSDEEQRELLESERIVVVSSIGTRVETGHEYGELRGVQVEAAAEIHREPELVYEVGKELTIRYAEGASVEGEAAEALRAQARKRVAIRFEPRRVASWDHRKLGGTY